MKTRMFTLALVLALLLTAVIAVSASAAPTAPGGGPQIAATRNLTMSHVRSTQFSSSPTAPVNMKTNKVALPKYGKHLPKAPQAPSPKVLSIPFTTGYFPTGYNPKLTIGAKGLNANDNGSVNGFDLTPPDQALCAGNGYVMEGVNVVWKIYKTNLTGYSSNMAINAFYGLTPDYFTSDPKCYYDYDTGKFFATILAIDPTGTSSAIMIGVSQTGNPSGGWNIYALDTTDSFNPGCPCLPDQPLLGASKDALILNSNEYSLVNPWPIGYNGAQLYAIDKKALTQGSIPPLVNVAYFNVGLNVPTPDGVCNDPTNPGFWCWYSLQPTTAPFANYDNGYGGAEWLLSSLDFWNQYYGAPGSLDNRITAWYLWNLSSLHGFSPNVSLTWQTLNTQTYGGPQWADQADGNIPLGNNIYGETGVGPIQTNDDRMNQTVYAGGYIWGAVNTILNVGYHGVPETHTGIAWFAFKPFPAGGGLAKVQTQGYIGAKHEDVLFPSVSILPNGKGVFTYSLTGDDYHPSAAYSMYVPLTGIDGIHIAAMGADPLDDFCEYDLACGGGALRPRFGDYSAAVPYIPAPGYTPSIFIATEYVQYPNCSDAQFSVDPTCGGTRDPYANWGSFLGKIVP